VTEMEVAVRARRESENGWHDPPTLVIAGLDPAIVQEPLTI
jgi:hypothetical protein